MISYLVDIHMYRISSRSDTVATIYFTGCFVWLLFEAGAIGGRRLSKGGYYSRRVLLEGGYYSRVATFQGRRLFEAGTIGGRRLSKGGDYQRAASIRKNTVT